MYGSRTPMYGSQTPLHDGSRTPHYGGQTPLHEGSRTPSGAGGSAWDPSNANTPSRWVCLAFQSVEVLYAWMYFDIVLFSLNPRPISPFAPFCPPPPTPHAIWLGGGGGLIFILLYLSHTCMAGTFPALVGFQDSDFFQKTIKVVLRYSLSVFFTSFRIQSLSLPHPCTCLSSNFGPFFPHVSFGPLSFTVCLPQTIQCV